MPRPFARERLFRGHLQRDAGAGPRTSGAFPIPVTRRSQCRRSLFSRRPDLRSELSRSVSDVPPQSGRRRSRRLQIRPAPVSCSLLEQVDLVLLAAARSLVRRNSAISFCSSLRRRDLGKMADRVGRASVRGSVQFLDLVHQLDGQLDQSRRPVELAEELVKYRLSLVPLMAPVHFGQPPAMLVA